MRTKSQQVAQSTHYVDELAPDLPSIYQDLVEQHGFAHAYNSVKRFVRGLRVREPARYDVLEYGPGEEAQVDYGQGAPTRRCGRGCTRKRSGRSVASRVFGDDDPDRSG